MNRTARIWASQNGTTAVETALVAPVFIALLFGLLEGAIMLWTQLGLQTATDRAARCAAIDTSRCGTSTLLQNYAAGQALSAKIPASSFTLTSETCGAAVTGLVKVRFVATEVTLSARSCFPR